jgi:hypothetical protein
MSKKFIQLFAFILISFDCLSQDSTILIRNRIRSIDSLAVLIDSSKEDSTERILGAKKIEGVCSSGYEGVIYKSNNSALIHKIIIVPDSLKEQVTLYGFQGAIIKIVKNGDQSYVINKCYYRQNGTKETSQLLLKTFSQYEVIFSLAKRFLERQ